jgi:mannose-1-phosphate guanylyltransferase
MTDTSDEPVAVILAGGQGSRLWPISRDRAPKQFQPVVRDRPLLTGTIERLSEIVDPSRIHVSTRARFAEAALETLGPVPPDNLILEEDPAGPATAFALSIATLSHKYGNAPALIAPSDHLITEEDAFNAASRDMLEQLAKTPRSMVVLGAEPTRFDASLGYIHTKGGDDAVQVIDSFHEKPDEDVVELLALVASGYQFSEIAEMKFLSPLTIRNNLSAARERVGAKNLTHLCVIAVDAGLIKKNGQGFKPVQEERVA